MADHINYIDPTPIGFADTVQAGRIGSGVFSVLIDFAKFGGVANNDFVLTGLLPGGMKIRQTAVAVAEPLQMVDNAGAEDTFFSATLTPYAVTSGGSTTLGAGEIATNARGETSFPSAVAVVVDPLVETKLNVKVAFKHGTEATNGALVAGRVLFILYADYSPSKDEIEGIFPSEVEKYAKIGA